MKMLVIIYTFVSPVEGVHGWVDRFPIPAARCAEAERDLTRAGAIFPEFPNSGYYNSIAAWCE